MLNDWVCTRPSKRLYRRQRGKHHPAVWELQVQSYIRDLRPPLPANEALLLGFDPADDIAAVIHFGFTPDDDQFLIYAVACSIEHRGRGYGYQALQTALEVMRLTKESKGLDCGVFCRIDPRNIHSRRLFDAAGFDYLNDHEGLELWVRDLDHDHDEEAPTPP